MDDKGYVHGYSEREGVRLGDQARTLTDLLHHDTAYPAGSKVLELGCGVGAQTVLLARSSPGASITSVDISPMSISAASDAVSREGHRNVTFVLANIFDLPFPPESFDHVFICFVLEHLAEPEKALSIARGLLRPGGTLTVIEGDHGSAYFHPMNAMSQRAIDCLVEVQKTNGGDALIGRRLFQLISGAGFGQVQISPRTVYADPSRPDLVEGFIRNTFTAMVEGVGETVISSGMMAEEEWNEGIRGLYRTGDGGTFLYTFFKGTATR